jgi:transposase
MGVGLVGDCADPAVERIQDGVIESLRVEVDSLRGEVAALRRWLGRDSSNSSQPPSQDDPGARAKAKADKRSGQSAAGPKRSQGRQPGHRGSGLERVAVPNRAVAVEPAACGCCGAGLAEAPGRVWDSVQVRAPSAA